MPKCWIKHLCPTRLAHSQRSLFKSVHRLTIGQNSPIHIKSEILPYQAIQLIMKHQAISQLLAFAGLLLPSLATPLIPSSEDDTIHIAVGRFGGAALQRLADDVKKHGASQTEVTVICTLSSFHLGQSCREFRYQIFILKRLPNWVMLSWSRRTYLHNGAWWIPLYLPLKDDLGKRDGDRVVL